MKEYETFLDWIKSFSWLAYSTSLDGGSCLPCVLFGDKFPSKLAKIMKLFLDPVVYRPDAKATFSRHVCNGVVSALHRETTNMCFGLNFLLCYFRSENTGNCLYSSISLLNLFAV